MWALLIPAHADCRIGRSFLVAGEIQRAARPALGGDGRCFNGGSNRRRLTPRRSNKCCSIPCSKACCCSTGNRKIYLANRAFKNLFGLKIELRGKTVMEALRLHELDELVKQVEAKGQVLNYELKLPDLSERWLQVNAAAISNSAGEREGTILVFHDLTRLKQLERTREEFVANVSHELRTPLSLIKGYVETLLDGARNNPEVAERFLRIIERNTQRLDLLIQDLLTISALESGRIKLVLQPVNLRPLAEKVFADLNSRAENKNVQLINELPELTGQGGRQPALTRCWPISWTMPSNMAARRAASWSAAERSRATKLKFCAG